MSLRQSFSCALACFSVFILSHINFHRFNVVEDISYFHICISSFHRFLFQFQALNNLQCTVAGFKQVTADNVFKVIYNFWFWRLIVLSFFPKCFTVMFQWKVYFCQRIDDIFFMISERGSRKKMDIIWSIWELEYALSARALSFFLYLDDLVRF